MAEITTFVFQKEQEISTQLINGEPWFLAKDVCEVLGFANYRDALKNHVFLEDVAKRDTLTKGGRQRMSWINESGLYCLIFGSRLPTALKFKRWVTSEVLPQLRKTGSYSLTNAQPQLEQKTCSWMDLRSCRKDPLKAGRQGFYCAANFLSAFMDTELENSKLTREFEVFCSNIARMDSKDREAKNAFLSVFVKVLRSRLEHLRLCDNFLDEVEDELTSLLNKKRMMFEKEVLTEQ